MTTRQGRQKPVTHTYSLPMYVCLWIVIRCPGLGDAYLRLGTFFTGCTRVPRTARRRLSIYEHDLDGV